MTVEFSVTSRPVLVEINAGPSTVADALARLEAAKARASLYGFSDPVAGSQFVADSVEADFAGGVYRQGYVQSDQLVMLPGWAFSRTGAGSARTAGGGVVSFATGVPRLTDRGLLMEAAATNLSTRSAAIDDAAWVKTGAVTATADAGIAPDGTTTADRVQLGAAPGYMQKSASGLTDGAPMTVTFWAVGTGTLGLRSGRSGLTATRVLTGTWQRFEWTAIAGNVNELIQLTNNDLVAGATASVDMHLWGFQVEATSHASSYTATTSAAATRGADAASLTVASAAEGGVFFDVELASYAPPSAQMIFSWAGVAGTWLAAWRNEGDQITVAISKPDGVIIASAGGFGGARRVRGFVGWGAGKLVRTFDGVHLGDIAYPLTAAFTTVRPGADVAGGDWLNGSIRRLLVARRLPTPGQRAAMTGG